MHHALSDGRHRTGGALTWRLGHPADCLARCLSRQKLCAPAEASFCLSYRDRGLPQAGTTPWAGLALRVEPKERAEVRNTSLQRISAYACSCNVVLTLSGYAQSISKRVQLGVGCADIHACL